MDVSEVYERAVNGGKLSEDDFQVLKENFNDEFVLKLIINRLTEAIHAFFEAESKGTIQGFDGLLSELNK